MAASPQITSQMLKAVLLSALWLSSPSGKDPVRIAPQGASRADTDFSRVESFGQVPLSH